MHEDIETVLFSEEDLRTRIEQMGLQITEDYADRDLVVVSVLRGAAIFMSDLCRAIDLSLEMDYLAVSSYGDETESSGVVRMEKDLSSAIEGRDVLLLEDIYDSGLTLRSLLRTLQSRRPASLETAVLLHKQTEQQEAFDLRYVGFTCPDAFIVGYGLDYAQRYRNLPYIGVLKPEVYQRR